MRSLIIIILTFLVVSCDEFKDESFSASPQDLKAIDALADSVSIAFSSELVNSYKASWVNARLDTIALYDSLAANDVTLAVLDTAYTVSLAGDTSYAAFVGNTSEATFYIGDYLEVNIVDASGNISTPDDVTMELATIFESLNGPTSKSYHIRSRYVYSQVTQKALLQFIKNEQTLGNSFKLIINQ